jgi:hypothetical protein
MRKRDSEKNVLEPLIVSHPDAGCLFFAVTGRGAFARSLTMPFGAALEVNVSPASPSTSGNLIALLS